LTIFLSPEIATSISAHVPFYDTGLWCPVYCLGLVDSIRYVALSSWFVSTNFGTCSYHCPLSHFAPFLAYVEAWLSTHATMPRRIFFFLLLPVLDMFVKCGLFSRQMS
jgi:hypothetical protein